MRAESIKFKLLKLQYGVFIYLLSSFCLHAQYQLEGLEKVKFGSTTVYSIKDSSGNPPNPSFYEWNVLGGFFTASNKSYYATNNSTVSIEWRYPGAMIVMVEFYDSYWDNDYSYNLRVEVVDSFPDNPTLNSNACSPVLTRSGTPQNGDTWYWQGKDANGTSITKGSGTTYIPNEGSGTYYIRARNADGVWSFGSGSVEVIIISQTLWYTDVDNDGFGDPTSTPISSCTQPSGYVSNNFDECPTQAGNLLNNGCSGSGNPGSTDKNYVHTITPLIAVNDVSQITNDDDKLENVTYFDGLGRTIQSVGVRAGGQHQDIKSPAVYDEFGRQAKTYLPYATVTSSISSYTSNTTIISNLNAYYLSKFPNQLNTNPNAYAEKRFDNSPLSRVLESGTPGEDWLIDPNSDNDYTTKYEYATNAPNEVYMIDYPGAGQSLSITSYYTLGELLKNTVKNQNWVTADGKVNTKNVFTDKSGKKIAEFSYILENSILKTLKTYYVYDNSGNLVYMLTPKLFTIISGTTISVTNLNDLAFQYKYDAYNRQIEQKAPGKKQWEYMVYDQLDRPILTQDKNLKDYGKWLFTKYDAFGRAIYSGLYTSSLTRDQLQTAVDTYISGNTTNLSNIESRTSASSIGGVTINYSNNAYPTTGLEVLTVNYYDDYNFTDTDKPTTPIDILGQTVTTRTKGLSTASWTKTLGATSWAKSYTFYNEKASVIYVYEKNHLGGYTQNKSKLDFRGKVEGSLTEHKKSSLDIPLVIKDYFTYDHVERPLSHTQRIGGDNNVVDDDIIFDDQSPSSDGITSHTASRSITMLPGFTGLPGFKANIETFDRELIAYNTYNELGQLINKRIGGKADQIIANSTGLQTVDYTYDIRGALKAINDVDAIGDDLFAYELNYESGEGANFNAQYNGNIAQMVWKSAHNNTKKTYYYDYDDLDRFKKARYGEGASLTTNTLNFNAEVTGYDPNGNITGLTRTGASSNTIDNLSYYYDTGNGNQLMKIVDASGTDGFTNGSTGSNEDYVYDDNGNLTQDLNKNISLIEYNHLDLVTKVTFTDGKRIEFLYDASGAKLQMQFIDGSNKTTTNYIGGFQYVGGILRFFPTPEGYFEVASIPASGLPEGDYVYTLRDHLGNNRVAFKDVNGDNIVNSTDILSSTDYYPMGLIHNDEFVQNSDYNYKYQGKEKLLANGYNMYDFGSRMYDASVGRWFNTDPQNQFGSPYLAMGNNWVMSVDPNGEFSWIVGALISGAINLGVDYARGNVNSWEDAALSFVGGATGSSLSGYNSYSSVVYGTLNNQYNAIANGLKGTTFGFARNITVHLIKKPQDILLAPTAAKLYLSNKLKGTTAGRIVDFSMGADVGTAKGVMDTGIFIGGLFTGESWVGMYEGLVFLGKYSLTYGTGIGGYNPYFIATDEKFNQQLGGISQSLDNLVDNWQNGSDFDRGVIFGYAVEKVAEIPLMRRLPSLEINPFGLNKGYGLFGKEGLKIGNYKIEALYANPTVGQGAGTIFSLKQMTNGGALFRWDYGLIHGTSNMGLHSTIRFYFNGVKYGSGAQRTWYPSMFQAPFYKKL